MKPQISQEKDVEKTFFDRYGRAGSYERFAEPSYKKILSLFDQVIKPKPGENLLDMGCGTGAFAVRLKQAFPFLDVSGMDISPECVIQANKSHPNVKFLAGDVEKTQLPSASVDIICYFGLLHHFPDFNGVAAEARRILKPGGRVFSFDPHHRNPFFWLFRAHESPFYVSTGVTSQERLLTAREFTDVFQKNGFSAKARVISGIKFLYVESPFLRIFMSAYNVFDQVLGISPLAPHIGAWVVGWAQKPE